MTTITIKDGKPLPKTEFQTIEELLDWAVNYFQEEQPLSREIIEKAERAKREINAKDSTFRVSL